MFDRPGSQVNGDPASAGPHSDRKFQAIQDRAEERPALLHSATTLLDLGLPSLRLEKLAGDRKGQYSIRINDQYRVCFEWRDGEAYEVEIVDYH